MFWRCDGLVVSELDSGSSNPGLRPGWGQCIAFLGNTIDSHSASSQSGVQMGTFEFNARKKPAMD